MTAPSTKDNDRPEKESEASAPPSTNTIGGNAIESVQANSINTLNMFRVQDKAVLFARQVNENELDDVRKHFVSPGGFERAEAILATGHVLVLLGKGTGRTFTAQRLLDEQACTRIVHLNPERPMASVQADELRSRDGYVWDLSEQGSRPFKGWHLERIRRLVTDTTDCWLVIILNDRLQVPSEAGGWCVELTPDVVALAEAAISRKCPGDDRPTQVLAAEFAELLLVNPSPEHALLAADLAIRVAREELTEIDARRMFEDGFDREVTDHMNESWETIEYTLMFTIALLQNEPFQDVIEEARKLDDKIREGELKEGKKLQPRRAFVKPNDQLLAMIGARKDLRDNPSHPGLDVETVRFVRAGWAEAVLCRIWQYYHVQHDVLIDWMCGLDISGRYFGRSVWALSTLISQVPAGDRLRELNRLALRGGLRNWKLAAATLARLEDRPEFRDLVQQALLDWQDGAFHQKCAAIVFYWYRFDQLEPTDAMAKIAEVAREKAVRVHEIAVGIVLALLTVPERLPVVLGSVASWLDDRKTWRDKDGLRLVAMQVGVDLLRLTDTDLPDDFELDPVDVAEQCPDECRHLVDNILDNGEYSVDVLNRLVELSNWPRFMIEDRYTRKNASELVRIARLVSPDLRWRARSPVVTRLCQRYPGRRKEIRRIFRIARKAERSIPGLGVA